MIEVRRLDVRYPEAHALRGVDLSIAPGSFVLIGGPSGGGKSALAHALMGLIPQTMPAKVKGHVSIAGLDPRRHSVAQLATRVGLVFQNPATQLFNGTVEGEVAFGPRNLNLPSGEIAARHLTSLPQTCTISIMDIPSAIAAIAPNGWLTPAQRRRFMIDMCRRRIRPGTGSGSAFLQRRSAMNTWPDLRPILEGVPWVIVGAVATRAYMPERATKDLDVLVRRQDGAEVRRRLEAAGYRYISSLAMPGFLVHSAEGLEVDVILGDYPWLDEALAHPRKDPAGYPVLDLPYLVLMKMASFRAQDMADVTRMLSLASEQELARVRAGVARYAPDEAEDLESLIYLGQVEMGKVPKEPLPG